ncbi:hypothetical protein TNIN_153801 [Trichonephila inaurata madagascariensis]|uniref:Uncharacterized protein n=1 Tax=Trichonephila inaurata madagascariensis TaxID=2747483 RepID=A0A8X6IDH5_9ARAC|nr:hypothetical protein TNIN_153801 [Trichonephila inaurata madagascariensis]
MFKPTLQNSFGAVVLIKLFDEISNVDFIDGLPSDLSQIRNALIIIDDLMSGRSIANSLRGLTIWEGVTGFHLLGVGDPEHRMWPSEFEQHLQNQKQRGGF